MSKKKNKHKRGTTKTLSSQAKENIYNSGISYFQTGEYEKAIQVWSGISKDPDSNIAPQLAEAHFRNAISKYDSGN
ncbi:hypothetical protein FJZ33_10490, partial [Candidatus Poribacteria bacterium]|nr:hypothetical protein [Candidatus Poribacteria bacterium]